LTLPSQYIYTAKKAIFELAGRRQSLLRVNKSRPLNLQSASPNGRVSLNAVLEDAFAFYRRPRYLFDLV
jgi:hypothetical protein